MTVDETPDSPAATRQVRTFASPRLVPLLRELNVTLLATTYQAGKLVVIGADEQDELSFSFHTFDQPMGIAVSPRGVAVGCRNLIWILRPTGDLARRLEPAGRFDAGIAARQAYVTGEIRVHELAWAGDELWGVNTLFSCLATFDAQHSFVPRWRPPFVSALAAEDRCHLNGLAMVDDRPAYVTVLADADGPEGWRKNKREGGRILEVAGGEVVTAGLSMPHSPRVYHGNLWVLDSGRGQLTVVHPGDGRRQVVAAVPGYARGLAFAGDYAFLGLSKIRETATFGDVPIAETGNELKCGIGVIDLRTGTLHAYLEFLEGIDEIFDVQVVPQVRCLACCGPTPQYDDGRSLWIVPPPTP